VKLRKIDEIGDSFFFPDNRLTTNFDFRMKFLILDRFEGVTAAQAASVGQLGGLRGCLSQLELDGRRIGLPEVLETNSIQAGCLWQYPCEYILLHT
jgi:hypothetical protein